MTRRSHSTFNPFIVLSDVTMASLVVVCCLFMAHTYILQQTLEKVEIINKHNTLLNRIVENENEILSTLSTVIGLKIPLAPARGPDRMLLRLVDPYSFDQNGLTGRGRRMISQLGIVLKDALKKQMHLSVDLGPLVEIQVQGHATDASLETSLNRARDAEKILAGIEGFPTSLITVLGAGSRRKAYRATDELINEYRKKGVTGDRAAIVAWLNAQHKTKTALPDRIDILLIYAGDTNDDSYVTALDEFGRPVGPKNDTSTSYPQ